MHILSFESLSWKRYRWSHLKAFCWKSFSCSGNRLNTVVAINPICADPSSSFPVTKFAYWRHHIPHFSTFLSIYLGNIPEHFIWQSLFLPILSLQCKAKSITCIVHILIFINLFYTYLQENARGGILCPFAAGQIGFIASILVYVIWYLIVASFVNTNIGFSILLSPSF